MNKNWYENIPVMINNHGDALTDNQVEAVDIDKKELYISYKDCRVVQECIKYD